MRRSTINKNRWEVLFLSACLLLMTGCTKFLTHDDPAGITDADFWNTEKDATNALNIIYNYIPGGTSGSLQVPVMYFSGLSDEAVDRSGAYDDYVKGLQDNRWNPARLRWRGNWLSIRRANRFMEHVGHCFMDPQLKKRMKYEARALRAYYHMLLLMTFGNIPVVDHALTPKENKMSRDSSEKVYNFIVSELTICADSLPLKYDNKDNWRISSGACLALISRLALYFNDFSKAKEAAKKVINTGIYGLYKSTDPNANSYEELFSYTGELNNERIFFSRNGCSNAWTTLAPFGIGGRTYISPTADVVNSYETKQGKTLQELGPDSVRIYEKDPDFKDNRDPRLKASVFFPGETFNGTYTLDPFNNPSDRIGGNGSTSTGYWVKKYVDKQDQQKKGGTLDFMIIRYAEVLLNYVEALVELDDWQNSDVVKYLNQIRERAGMPDVNTAEYNTKAKIQQLVRRERESELAFEGQRYFDIRRWGIANQVMNGTVYGATDPQTGSKVTVEERHFDPDKDVLWPIPREELTTNSNIKQNPGYAN